MGTLVKCYTELEIFPECANIVTNTSRNKLVLITGAYRNIDLSKSGKQEVFAAILFKDPNTTLNNAINGNYIKTKITIYLQLCRFRDPYTLRFTLPFFILGLTRMES